MKILLLSTITCLLLGSGILKGQEPNQFDKLIKEVSNKNFTAKEVSHMAVFPGCERIDINNNKDLQSCLGKELNILLSEKLEKFADIMDQKGLTSAVAKLQFVIDKEGKIVQVKAMSGGNQELGIESVKAMNDIAGKIKKIQPAVLEDGTPVNLVFQLPVRFVLRDSRVHEFQWTEIVIYTLINENDIFEIRENPTESIFKVYDVSDGKNLFLGNFKSFDEVLSLEPYKSIYFSKDRGLITERVIDNELYRLYYSAEHKDFMDVYKVIDGIEELLESFPKAHLEYSSLYLKLILR